MPRRVDAADQKTEGCRAERRAGKIETVRRARRARQRPQAQNDGGYSDGNIDGEEPWPISKQQYRAGDRRADCRRHGDHDRVDAEAAPEHAMGIDRAHDGRVHAHDARGAKTLHDTGKCQRRKRIRQRAAQRCQREEHESAKINTPVADDVPKRRQWQQRDRDRELVAVDDPDGECGIGVQIARNHWQRNICDGAVHHRHGDAERDRHDRPIA